MTAPRLYRVVECPEWELERFINAAADAGYQTVSVVGVGIVRVVLLDVFTAEERARAPELELPPTGIA